MKKLLILSIMISISSSLYAGVKLSREEKVICQRWNDVYKVSVKTYKSNKKIKKEEYKKKVDNLRNMLNSKCNYKIKKLK